MSETRVRAATLLSKVFLHYLVLLDGADEMGGLWLEVVGIMDRLGNSGQGDNFEEAVNENLKNMLLVLSSGGYLAPPDENPQREELWNETWKRINRFQPTLFADLFPEEAGKPARPRASRDERAGKESVASAAAVDGREMDVAVRGGRGGEDKEDDGEESGDDEQEKEKVAENEG
jgi:brefeldin A-resistance guanine nucleotide exchange factor 1